MNYATTPSGKCSRTIRSLIVDHDETIELLAEETGIALSTLKRRLLGATPFTIDELGLIASHFGVTIPDLLIPMSERIASAEAVAS